MKGDYVDNFNILENKLNDSFKRIDMIFEAPEDLYSKVKAAKNIVAKHEKDKFKNIWKNRFFAIIDGVKKGPLDVLEMMNLVATDKIDKNTLVWTKGMKQWSKAGRLRVLQSILKKLPPPVQPKQVKDYEFIPDTPQPFEYPQLHQAPRGRGNFEESLKIVKKMITDSIKRQISA